MGYGSDDRDDNRWRDRDERNRAERGGGWRGEGRGGEGRGGEGRGGPGRDDDRGFFDRAGDQVRSWLGDDEAQRRREMDERRWEQEQRMRGGRDDESRSGGSGWNGGGWGNQPGESWHRDRPGVPGGWDRDRQSEREGRFSSSGGGEGRGNDRIGHGGGGFGGRPEQGHFDRNDPGRVGTSGPMGQRFSGYGGHEEVTRGGPGGDIHDPHYSEWRRRQIDDLDRDYDEYRREHQSKFETEFGGWRQKRAGQRQMLGKVAEHMEVVGSDGGHVGKVDKVRGDRIILAKSDPNADGMHHSVPCGWVDSVEDKIVLNRTSASAMDSWRNEDNGRALFERPDQGSEGPHALDRSFSGTYGSKKDD
ncbi:MAG TPA: DUF2171 domain-containing protein [Allosphingosinicella sp.]|nr:DUF2171 domain-containing protein [Allosphingosinicella sp.]